jgi:hypothetical protein
MVYDYKWPQMRRMEDEIKYDVDTSGNLSPGAATRMRMVALTPRGSLRRAAGSLSTQGYSSTQPTQFDAQALERELMPGFASYFTEKVQPSCWNVPSVWSKELACFHDFAAVLKLLFLCSFSLSDGNGPGRRCVRKSCPEVPLSMYLQRPAPRALASGALLRGLWTDFERATKKRSLKSRSPRGSAAALSRQDSATSGSTMRA